MEFIYQTNMIYIVAKLFSNTIIENVARLCLACVSGAGVDYDGGRGGGYDFIYILELVKKSGGW